MRGNDLNAWAECSSFGKLKYRFYDFSIFTLYVQCNSCAIRTSTRNIHLNNNNNNNTKWNIFRTWMWLQLVLYEKNGSCGHNHEPDFQLSFHNKQSKLIDHLNFLQIVFNFVVVSFSLSLPFSNAAALLCRYVLRFDICCPRKYNGHLFKSDFCENFVANIGRSACYPSR